MSTLREAATLLSDGASHRGAMRLVAHLGFGEPVQIDAAARVSLGIDQDIRRAYIANRPGLLRCCVLFASSSAAPRAVAARCVQRLTERSAHSLWLVVSVHPSQHALVVAVSPSASAARVAALVVDARHVVDSDAETVAAMADAVGDNDVLTHHRWRELLGRDALTRRFYRELEVAVSEMASTASGSAPEAARREIALLCSSRLLFVAFLEAKGWLGEDREFLRHQFEACGSGGVHRRLLDPLFFGTLNTPLRARAKAARAFGRVPFLNGGLFARTALERRWRDLRLSDDAIGGVICGLLGRFRVTAREESSSWSEAAVDPEMLGRAFECLMAADDRRRSGAFFTPLPILERVTTEAIDAWLDASGHDAQVRRALLAGEPVPADDRGALLACISAVRLLDPACGSGAFLVHAMERLADARRLAGDHRPVPELRREVLTQSIFGVDINPMAVWLCELRLWLSMVIDIDAGDGMDVCPLPNLDHHIRVGDTLAGEGLDAADAARTSGALAQLRARYARSTGMRKRTLGRALDTAERRIAVAHVGTQVAGIAARRRDLLSALRGRDLFQRRVEPRADERAQLDVLRVESRDARRRLAAIRAGGALPFSIRTHFADAADAGGFDIVIGNPPWVRLHRISPAMRASFAGRFRSWRDATWTAGATEARAGRGFASQVDLAGLFVERATQVTRPGGAIALLVPAKLWGALSAGGVRRVVADSCRIVALEDWSESQSAFDAVVYPSLLVARRAPDGGTPTMRGAIHRGGAVLAWSQESSQMPLDDTPGAPWLLLPPEVRNAFDLLASRGTRLGQASIGRPLLGVKTGCNDAFVVTPRPGWHTDSGAERVRSGAREDDIESALLRPVLRGEDVRAWLAASGGDAILWTHGPTGEPLRQLPGLTAEWLRPWRHALESRADAARAERWWTLFRTEAGDSRRTRVVWSDISRVPRAVVLEAGDPTVPLNTCYVLPAPSSDDAHAFAALLNSAVGGAWLVALAEPARGGYRRFLAWTLARFPIPRDWAHAVKVLAPIGRRAASGAPPDARALALAVARAYRIRLSRLEPLITWCLR